MIFDQANSEHVNNVTIIDGAVVAASGVRLINNNGGRIFGGVTFTVGGSTLVNQSGGVIRFSEFDQTYPVIVTGSSGADTVINGGTIAGSVALGDGADTFVERSGSVRSIDLGAGDDVYRFESTAPVPRWLSASGGEGYDRIVMAGSANSVAGGNNQYDGAELIGFEELVIAAGGDLISFSGYQAITLSGSAYGVTLIGSFNPTVDVALTGQGVTLQNSSIGAITGTGGSDLVKLTYGSTVTGAIVLGAGDDTLVLSDSDGSGLPTIAVPASGGAGSDLLSLGMSGSADRSFDFSFAQGFEKLDVSGNYLGSARSTARVFNASGLTDIDILGRVTLILTDSVSPDARVGSDRGAALILEAGSVIGRFGFPDGYDQSVDLERREAANSVTILNRGTIQGEVRFYTGDDRYDGRTGSVGGTVYGNAGNDTLLGGAGAERLVGGFGADRLDGNGGVDTLTGGAGNDVFGGTAAGLNGDTITDFAAGDRILISNATLAGFTFSLSGSTLTYSGGTLTLAGFTGTLSAVAAAGGGLGRPADFNGDGRSDILWRNDNGTVTDWLGTANGGFIGNFGNANLALTNDWQIAGTGDFNGDGRDDILWRAINGTVTNWLGTAEGGFVGNFGNANLALTNDWQVAGTGDFNGDGRDDILWRATNGTVTNWLGTANGGFSGNFGNANLALTNDWQVAGTGDFNGDGRDDILWRASNGTVTNWLGTANGGFIGNFGNANLALSSAWQIAGTGDFNGDGRDDILWRAANGAVTNWLGTASGGFVGNFANANLALSNEWQIAGTGDYNGDGRDDVLWRHADGTVTNWLGQDNGGFANNFANANPALANDWDIRSPDIFLF